MWGRPEASLPWLPTYVRQGYVGGVAFDGRGDRLAAAIDWNLVVVRLPERAGFPFPYRNHYDWSALAPLRFCADGRRLVMVRDRRGTSRTETSPQSVVCLDVEKGQETSGHTLHCRSAFHAFSPDSEWLAGIHGSSVVIEHVRDPSRWRRLELGRRQKLTVLAFCPDGQTLATADDEGRVKLWPWHSSWKRDFLLAFEFSRRQHHARP